MHSLDTTWNYSRIGNVATAFVNKKQRFDERYVKRLENTQIFCRDALRVIRNMDTLSTFHFIDPPYISTNQGHYSGYSIADFENLLKTCEVIKGKFLFTTFPSQILSDYAKKNGWFQIEFVMNKAASFKEGTKKTEVFTMNYQPSKEVLKKLNIEHNVT